MRPPARSVARTDGTEGVNLVLALACIGWLHIPRKINLDGHLGKFPFAVSNMCESIYSDACAYSADCTSAQFAALG